MRALLVFVLVAALAAGAAEAAPRIANACKLLTTADVSGPIGGKPQYTTRSTGSCTWNGPPYSKYTSGHDTLTLSVGPTTEAKFKRAMARAFARRVKGVGEIAYWQQSQVAVLQVFAKGYALTVFVPTQGSAPLTTAKRVANAALARLPA